jgi:hypothetical protein
MGIFSKVKELFDKKPIDSLKKLEEALTKLQLKKRYEILALIGTGGRLKGLPLVYAAEDENSLKIFTARITELLKMIENLSEERILRDFIINFNDSILFFKPIIKDISFMAIINENDDIIAIKQFIYKYEQLFQELLHKNS